MSTSIASASSSFAMGREARILAFFGLLAVLMTWPLVLTPGAATGLRADYSFNLWTAWWFGESVAGLHSPYFTDLLYHPVGVSLARAPLSPLNAIGGALLQMVLSPDAAYSVLILLHLTLAGWTFSLLAREETCGTGSTGAALLGGVVYAFAPFHFHYLCQINVFTFAFVPLAVLFLLRVYRAGQRRDMVGLCLSLAAVAATSSYYFLYTYGFAFLLLVLGRWAAPGVSWRGAAKRVGAALVPATALALLVFIPLLLETFGRDLQEGQQAERANDLLGFQWYGPPESVRVAWPTMVGYTTLALLLFSWRAVVRARFWLVVAAVFLVLSLGPTLQVAGHDTGVPLPFRVLQEVPIVSLARKPDRFFFFVQLCIALLVARAWQHAADRIGDPRRVAIATALACAVVAAELCPAPLARFPVERSPFLADIADDDGIAAIVELPPGHAEFVPDEKTVFSLTIDDRPPVHFVAAGRHNRHQILHGKPVSTAYATFLPVEDPQVAIVERLVLGYPRWLRGRSNDLVDAVREAGVDLVIQNKTQVSTRAADPALGESLWTPFVLSGSALVRARQLGPYEESPIPEPVLRIVRTLAGRAFGAPVHEDEQRIVWRVNDR